MSDEPTPDYENWTREQWLASDFRELNERLRAAHIEFGIDVPAGTLWDVAVVDALRAANARAEAAEHLLNNGCNLINYSVSGIRVSMDDWVKHIAECRALLWDAYREYDARGK